MSIATQSAARVGSAGLLLAWACTAPLLYFVEVPAPDGRKDAPRVRVVLSVALQRPATTQPKTPPTKQEKKSAPAPQARQALPTDLDSLSSWTPTAKPAAASIIVAPAPSPVAAPMPSALVPPPSPPGAAAVCDGSPALAPRPPPLT